MHKLELEHYMLYLQGEKLFICGIAEVLSPTNHTKEGVRKSHIAK